MTRTADEIYGEIALVGHGATGDTPYRESMLAFADFHDKHADLWTQIHEVADGPAWSRRAAWQAAERHRELAKKYRELAGRYPEDLGIEET